MSAPTTSITKPFPATVDAAEWHHRRATSSIFGPPISELKTPDAPAANIRGKVRRRSRSPFFRAELAHGKKLLGWWNLKAIYLHVSLKLPLAPRNAVRCRVTCHEGVMVTRGAVLPQFLCNHCRSKISPLAYLGALRAVCDFL